MDDDRRSRRPIARPMAATTTAATGRGGRRARARDAALPRLRFIDGEEEDARAARDGADADDRDAREEKKNEVGRGEEEGEETGASGEREATGGGRARPRWCWSSCRSTRPTRPTRRNPIARECEAYGVGWFRPPSIERRNGCGRRGDETR